jgi:hypothetical protein
MARLSFPQDLIVSRSEHSTHFFVFINTKIVLYAAALEPVGSMGNLLDDSALRTLNIHRNEIYALWGVTAL